jgi:muramoyltetrapeptide carboxypeptidase
MFSVLKLNKVPKAQPRNLHKGDTVAIVSTARKISEKELEPAILFATEMGLKIHLGMTIGAEDQQYAGNDMLRAQDFQEALDSPNIQAIWCARGGYGTIRMVDLLDFNQFQKQPKWIIGYSDVTVLHSHINKLGISTIHGQMCLEIEKRSLASRHTLQEALFGNMSSIAYRLENASYGKTGKATATLIGGNLSVLYSILDSPSEIDWQGKILFIEDLDEMLYHIDRMMQNLKRSGRLQKLAGLVVGGMSVMRDNSIPFGKTAVEIISETISDYDYPVCFHFPSGHIEDNRALILGKEITLEVRQEQVRLTYI